MIDTFITKEALELLARMIEHEKDWIAYQSQFISHSESHLEKWTNLDKDSEMLEQLCKVMPVTKSQNELNNYQP